jgi:hypothetical protein
MMKSVAINNLIRTGNAFGVGFLTPLMGGPAVPIPKGSADPAIDFAARPMDGSESA